MSELLKKIDYALRKDSLTDAERVSSARQLVTEALRADAPEASTCPSWIQAANAALVAYEADLGEPLDDQHELGRIDDSCGSSSFRIRVGHIRGLLASLAPQTTASSDEPSHVMCIGWPTIRRLQAGEAVWFDDIQAGAVAADDLLEAVPLGSADSSRSDATSDGASWQARHKSFSEDAAAWFYTDQPYALPGDFDYRKAPASTEPRGCPTPGACSCPSVTPAPSDAGPYGLHEDVKAAADKVAEWATPSGATSETARQLGMTDAELTRETAMAAFMSMPFPVAPSAEPVVLHQAALDHARAWGSSGAGDVAMLVAFGEKIATPTPSDAMTGEAPLKLNLEAGEYQRLAALSRPAHGGREFTDDDLYLLFLMADDCARYLRASDPLVNAMRERLLPIYRDWHKANPHRVHPVSLSRNDRGSEA